MALDKMLLASVLNGFKKQAFVPMPGGQPPVDPMAGGASMDPAVAGGAPMDPAMAGGMPMDPAMAGGGMPVDPAAGGMPVDPAAGGAPVDPMAGGAPVDPAAAGAMPMDPAMMGGAMPGQVVMSMQELIEFTKVILGVAAGTSAGDPAAAGADGAKPKAPKASINDVMSRLDQLTAALGGAAPAPQPM